MCLHPKPLCHGSLIQELDISHNMLTGALPTYLAAMSNLAVLRLNGNSGFSGPLPFEHATFVRLQLLDIRGTRLQVADHTVRVLDDASVGLKSSAAVSGNASVMLLTALHEIMLPEGMYLERCVGAAHYEIFDAGETCLQYTADQTCSQQSASSEASASMAASSQTSNSQFAMPLCLS